MKNWMIFFLFYFQTFKMISHSFNASDLKRKKNHHNIFKWRNKINRNFRTEEENKWKIYVLFNVYLSPCEDASYTRLSRVYRLTFACELKTPLHSKIVYQLYHLNFPLFWITLNDELYECSVTATLSSTSKFRISKMINIWLRYFHVNLHFSFFFFFFPFFRFSSRMSSAEKMFWYNFSL